MPTYPQTFRANTDRSTWISINYNQMEYDICLLSNQEGKDRYCLWLCAFKGQLVMTRLLVEDQRVSQKPWAHNRAPIVVAAMNGHLEVVKYLAENGEGYLGSVDLAIKFAARKSHLEIVRYLLVEGGTLCEGKTILTEFIRVENIKIVKHLVDVEHVDINERDCYGRTALMLAAYVDSIEIASYLITKLADVNAVSSGESTENENPLRNAAEKGLVGMCTLLLDKGAFIDSCDGLGRTALMIAVEKEQYEATRMLLLRGANVNCLDHWHQSPVYYAASQGQLAMVKLLYMYGADLNICCEDNKTPVQVATENHFHRVAELIIARLSLAGQRHEPHEAA